MCPLSHAAIVIVQSYAPDSIPTSSPLRAFLSFATEDKVLVDAFRRRIELHNPDIELLDHAAVGDFERDWKQECARKIDQSTVLICLVGASTHESEAVSWEIGRGLALGKRVVAVSLSRRPVRIPEILTRNAIEPLPSTVNSIFSSVAELAPGGQAHARP